MRTNPITDQLEEITSALSTPTATDWISSLATALMAVVAILALIYAGKQIGEAKKSRELTRMLEIERSQPYVVIFTEPSEATPLAIDLVIKNFGPTAAKNVRVALDPWPMRAEREGNGAQVGVPEVLSVLAPGQEWRTSWEWGPHRQNSSLPDRHAGEVTFEGINGASLSSPALLDLGIYKSREWMEIRGMHDAAKALRDIRDTMKKWTESPRGLSVYSRDGDEKDSAASKRAEDWKAARARAEQKKPHGREDPVSSQNLANGSTERLPDSKDSKEHEADRAIHEERDAEHPEPKHE